MEVTGSIAGIFLLGAVAWQDFRSRTISAWLLPAIALAFVLAQWRELSVSDLLRNSLVNISLLCVQLGILWLWLHLKNIRLRGTTEKGTRIRLSDHIGMGDILFLVCIAPVFYPVNFVLFCTAANLMALFMDAIRRMMRSSDDPRIPLAGWLGFYLSLLLILRVTGTTHINFSDELLLFNLLN